MKKTEQVLDTLGYTVTKPKQKIYQILTVSDRKGNLSWYFDIFIITLIFLNIVAIVLESVAPLRDEFNTQFYYFEIFSVFIFTVEYLLRVWSANADERYTRSLTGNLKFALTPMAIIDLLAVLPFYLPFIGIDLRVLRMLRMMRIFRLFKIARYLTALSLMKRVFSKKKEELVIALIFTIFLLLMASTLMYYVENEVQPENFSSIPETMWWGIATLTTVGYGDIYPISGLGQVLGGIIAIIGIGLFALPTGILASGFSDELSQVKLKNNNCPSCGEINKIPTHN